MDFITQVVEKSSFVTIDTEFSGNVPKLQTFEYFVYFYEQYIFLVIHITILNMHSIVGLSSVEEKLCAYDLPLERYQALRDVRTVQHCTETVRSEQYFVS